MSARMPHKERWTGGGTFVRRLFSLVRSFSAFHTWTASTAEDSVRAVYELTKNVYDSIYMLHIIFEHIRDGEPSTPERGVTDSIASTPGRGAHARTDFPFRLTPR